MTDDRPHIRRRTYLTLVAAGVVGAAGCSDTESVDGQERTTAESTTATTATTATAAPTATSTTSEMEEPTERATEESATADRESELAAVSFEGEYFDTHAHWLPSMAEEIPRLYAEQMEKHDIGASVLFSPSAMADREYTRFLERLTEPGGEYLPFMSAPPPGPNMVAELRDLYGSAGPAFWGLGEWKPQTEPSPDFDGDRLTRLWELAADIDVPVMYHPQADQEGQVEPALASNPDTTFLLHGHQMLSYGQSEPGLGPTLPRLLEEYDNLYWTMDFATMSNGSLVGFSGAQRFHEWDDSNGELMVDLFQTIVADLLDAGPTQVMWGTDIAQAWNLTDDVFSRVMEFTEQVLDGVPSDHHDAYKYGNAVDFFGV